MCAIWKGTLAVSQIIGKIGSVDYMRWRNKNVVRQSPPIVTDPKSLKQQAVRAALGGLSNRWRTVLTANQKAAWESYAQVFKTRYDAPSGIYQIPQGNKGNFDGIQAYILVNTKLFGAGIVPVDTPPMTGAKTLNVENFTAVWNPVSNAIDCAWTLPVGSGPADSIRIWIDHHQELFHRQIAITTVGNPLLISIVFVRSIGGVQTPLTNYPGTTCIVQPDYLTSSGGVSAPGQAVDVLI